MTHPMITSVTLGGDNLTSLRATGHGDPKSGWQVFALRSSGNDGGGTVIASLYLQLIADQAREIATTFEELAGRLDALTDEFECLAAAGHDPFRTGLDVVNAEAEVSAGTGPRHRIRG